MTFYNYIGDMINRIDILGTGASLPVLALCIAISIAVSNGRTRNFMLGMLITTFISATVIFTTTQNYAYFMLTALVIIVGMFMPDDAVEGIFGIPKE